MIDTTLVPFAYGFLVVGAVAFALAVAGLAIAYAGFTGAPVKPALPGQRNT